MLWWIFLESTTFILSHFEQKKQKKNSNNMEHQKNRIFALISVLLN